MICKDCPLRTECPGKDFCPFGDEENDSKTKEEEYHLARLRAILAKLDNQEARALLDIEDYWKVKAKREERKAVFEEIEKANLLLGMTDLELEDYNKLKDKYMKK